MIQKRQQQEQQDLSLSSQRRRRCRNENTMIDSFSSYISSLLLSSSTTTTTTKTDTGISTMIQQNLETRNSTIRSSRRIAISYHNRDSFAKSSVPRQRTSFEQQPFVSTTVGSSVMVVILLLLSTIMVHETHSFVLVPVQHQQQQQQLLLRQSQIPFHVQQQKQQEVYGKFGIPSPSLYRAAANRDSALHVWWYGGLESVESNINYGSNTDSCELVAVRIERTSPNSRRILGDITIAAPLIDVWTILTDYNRLSIHVPNLVESRIERPISTSGSMGDGQFQCRLYQKGAQKIIGFEFGASVTMDMKEIILLQQQQPTQPTNRLPPGATTLNLSSSSSLDSSTLSSMSSNSNNIINNMILQEERKITFKCVDSFFFREFDGEWKVQEYCNVNTGDVETVLSYVVDVRPKGPVPVAALEWRIREDVPTNLRAVKQSALNIQLDEVLMSKRRRQQQQQQKQLLSSSSSSLTSRTSTGTIPNNRRSSSLSPIVDAVTNAVKQIQPPPSIQKRSSRISALARSAVQTKIQWLKDETMAAYLTDNTNTNPTGNSGSTSNNAGGGTSSPKINNR